MEKDGQNTKWKVGELGILCQQEERGVDSKGMWKSCVHKSRRLPFWDARRKGWDRRPQDFTAVTLEQF